MKNIRLKCFIVSFILWITHGTSNMGKVPEKPCSLRFSHEQGFTSDAMVETRYAPHAGSSYFSPLALPSP
jgi:hypothetical protein